ncbi:unnamed protein product [Citrullus colocynthis]|uniref:PB1-like domain-containing protein n=1 Tax=Citrullus colocynthis TaxID=252529 RepID=A0ABP0XUI1_9ROSI
MVEVHHGGFFVHKPNVDYVSSKVDYFYDYDSKSWSMIKCINLVQLMGYAAPYYKLWGKDPTLDIGGYKPLESNKDVERLLRNCGTISEIFVEHCITHDLSNGGSLNLDDFRSNLRNKDMDESEEDGCIQSTLKDVVVYIENDAGRNGNSRREGQKIVEMDIESDKDLDFEELHSLNDSSNLD